MSEKRDAIWQLIEAIQRLVGGGVAKKIVLTAYFDASGNCVGREEIEVVKLFPKDIFDHLKKETP